MSKIKIHKRDCEKICRGNNVFLEGEEEHTSNGNEKYMDVKTVLKEGRNWARTRT
jgi:hypothetical protein